MLLIVTLAEGRPNRRALHPHPLDRRGPLAKRHLATIRSKQSIKKYELETPVDIPEVNKGLHLKQGDIMEPPESRSTIMNEVRFWPQQIPIVYTSDITPLKRAILDISREEYELRTCLSLPERTEEENYITFRSLGGCWSYIGMVGGPQNISIGDGCERIGTGEHEVMHALGIYHEQSRTDRDDYVEVVFDKINPGAVGNFEALTLEEADDRRVPYDFYSIMHYSKLGFTIDGNITIRTRDPQFQDTIGQRGTFSEGDVTKIGRMYGCSNTIRYTNVGNFEDEAEDGYTAYLTNSDVEWIQHKIGISDNAGATSRYLPNFDSTRGVDGEGSFMYLDTTNKFPGLSGILKSKRYKTIVARQCLEFSYYMKLDTSSTAALTVYIATIDDVTGEVITYGEPLQTFDQSTGESTEWDVHRMTVTAPETFRIVFYAKTDYYTKDIIAIDDVSITDKECDTSHFMVEGYSEKMNTMAVDEYFESPVMYTGHPGYAYKLLVYPKGTQEAIDGGYEDYMSLYFQLCAGSHDDELEWPFDQQFIRLSINDQGPNPNTRINALKNFLSSKDSLRNASYERPTPGECNTPVGYGNFERQEKFNTRMYLKHDVAYFSALIRDMRPFVGSTSAQLPNPSLHNDENAMLSVKQMKGGALSVDDSEEMERTVSSTTGELVVDSVPQKKMIPVTTAVIALLATSLSVFFFMALVVCCVASSYKKKLEYRTMLMSGINPLHLDTLKYSSLKGKI